MKVFKAIFFSSIMFSCAQIFTATVYIKSFANKPIEIEIYAAGRKNTTIRLNSLMQLGPQENAFGANVDRAIEINDSLFSSFKSGVQAKIKGESETFKLTPNAAYHIYDSYGYGKCDYSLKTTGMFKDAYKYVDSFIKVGNYCIFVFNNQAENFIQSWSKYYTVKSIKINE